MALEIEIKFRLADPAAFRARLRSAGAAHLDDRFEVNRILDTPERTLLARGCGLRLREARVTGGAAEHNERREVQLTFKGARRPGPMKIREEREFSASDAEALLSILAALGYREALRYEKRRELWRLSNCAVTIDELPRLGSFGEIEGPTAADVSAIRAALDITADQVVEESYVAMTAAHGDLAPNGTRRLTFSST